MLVAGQVLKEDGRVHDEVAASTETEEGNEEAQARPVGHCAGNDAADGADEERDVERILAADDVGAKAPEEGTEQHAGVGGDRQPILVSLLAELRVGRRGDDGLEKQDEGVDGIAA